MQLVLASSSPYRRALLERLGVPFTSIPPQLDESPRPQEAPDALTLRLARSKAELVAVHQSQCLVIGSDQIADLGGRMLGKPVDHATAVSQLHASSGQTVIFYTGVCVFDTRNGQHYEHLDKTRVRFRPLRGAEIERYLKIEKPYACAGSFKSEGIGISLFEAIESEDPTALIGLPLIGLCRLLRACGLALP